jgi:hypothetical protein
MFVVASASFRLLFVMIILFHERRKIVRFDVTEHPTAVWLAQQVTEVFPWTWRHAIWCATAMPPMRAIPQAGRGNGHRRNHNGTALPLAESLRRESHRLNPPRLSGP